MLLSETLLSFDEWKNLFLKENKKLPDDILEQQKQYEIYVNNYKKENEDKLR